MVTVQLPDFALRVHGGDGVGPACVLLQDRFGLDVNVLLYAARVGIGGPLTPPVLQAATARVALWHAEVVRPLRGVRRRLKSGPSPAPSPVTAELREQLQSLEIRAELIELGELDALVRDTGPGADDPTAQVTAALLLAVHAHSQRPLTADEDAALATIAAAAVAVATT
ncbi:TIGR02444 family protein [Mycobacterium dioxanotrophicus]|uniref:TIGR02444 family protein n=1 Tax=Mycobacterium dioxanotrophicus TaxID=482462 RepID=A0A1Y0CB64_9MYCO|nr:TIGR02444 family protein [Mycobacterium dioxanotrophicus]